MNCSNPSRIIITLLIYIYIYNVNRKQRLIMMLFIGLKMQISYTFNRNFPKLGIDIIIPKFNVSKKNVMNECLQCFLIRLFFYVYVESSAENSKQTCISHNNNWHHIISVNTLISHNVS